MPIHFEQEFQILVAKPQKILAPKNFYSRILPFIEICCENVSVFPGFCRNNRMLNPLKIEVNNNII